MAFTATPEDVLLLSRYDIRLAHDGAEWRYDGPAAYGPRVVRCSGHGPYWRGPVTRQFAVTLVTRVRALENER